MSVTITETAAREINSIIHQQGLDADKIRLRVGVKGGGCSGFSYILDLTEAQKDSDELWEFSYRTSEDGKTITRIEQAAGGAATAVAEPGTFTVRVVCDPKSYLYLNGTTIDFKDEIMGRGFVFSNPNATTTCGCGSSFSA
jgi:iron-sulfur cluster assembly protein